MPSINASQQTAMPQQPRFTFGASSKAARVITIVAVVALTALSAAAIAAAALSVLPLIAPLGVASALIATVALCIIQHNHHRMKEREQGFAREKQELQSGISKLEASITEQQALNSRLVEQLNRLTNAATNKQPQPESVPVQQSNPKKVDQLRARVTELGRLSSQLTQSNQTLLEEVKIVQPSTETTTTTTYTTLPADQFSANVTAVKNFPGDNPNAQIKAFGLNLQMADGINWPQGFAQGSKLDGTVAVLKATALQAQAQFESQVKAVSSEADLRYAKDALEATLDLLSGIEQINETYQARYINRMDHPGLRELALLRNSLRETATANLGRYHEILSNRFADDISASLRSPAKGIKDPDNAPNSLTALCNTWCNGLLSAKATEYINAGRKLVSEIQAGSKASGNEEDLLHLSWYLMGLALKKQQGYEQGTFVIEDSDQKIFQFLKNSTGQSGQKAYSRPSTHYAGRIPAEGHFGIDVFNPDMPCHKRTLLFGMVDCEAGQEPKQVLFIKPENFSAQATAAGGHDFFWHAFEMVVAQANKVLKPGSDDQPNMRKERVPANVLVQFKEILKTLSVDAATQNACVKEAKRYGIAYMHRYVNAHAGAHAAAFDQLLTGLDHLDKRTGREVYFTAAELVPATAG